MYKRALTLRAYGNRCCVSEAGRDSPDTNNHTSRPCSDSGDAALEPALARVRAEHASQLGGLKLPREFINARVQPRGLAVDRVLEAFHQRHQGVHARGDGLQISRGRNGRAALQPVNDSIRAAH